MKDIFAVIGGVVVLVVFLACGALGYGAYRVAVGANDAAMLINDFPATLEAINGATYSQEQSVIVVTVQPQTVVQPQPVEPVIVVTATPLPVVVVPNSATPAPTATVELDDRGLPSTGPYTGDQYEQCVAINANNGGLHVLPEPQRSLCQQYLDANQ